MQLEEAIRARKSIRNFSDEPVRREEVEKIVEAGVLAPTGKNTQNLLIVGVVDEKRLRSLFDRVPCEKNYYGATSIIFVLEKTPDDLSDLNAGACMENMLLEATALGVDTCWIHSTRDIFAEDEYRIALQEILELDEPLRLLESIALGHKKADTPSKIKDINNGKVL